MRIKTLWKAILVVTIMLLYGTAHGAIIPTSTFGTVEDTNRDGIPDATRFDGNIARAINSTASNFFQEYRAILEFELTGISAPVSTATLELNPIRTTNTPVSTTLQLFGFSGNGVVDVSDFSAGILVASLPFFNETFKNVDITAFFNSLISSNASHAGFAIRVATPNSSNLTHYDFAARCDPNGTCYGNEMAQIVTTVPPPPPTGIPEPNILIVISIGLLGLGLIRKKV